MGAWFEKTDKHGGCTKWYEGGRKPWGVEAEWGFTAVSRGPAFRVRESSQRTGCVGHLSSDQIPGADWRNSTRKCMGLNIFLFDWIWFNMYRYCLYTYIYTYIIRLLSLDSGHKVCFYWPRIYMNFIWFD